MERKFRDGAAGVLMLAIAVAIVLNIDRRNQASEWVGVGLSAASLSVAFAVIGHARRQAIATLRAHLDGAWFWAAGRAGLGWSSGDVRPYETLLWASPKFSVLGQYSASTFGQVGLLGNMALDPALSPKLATVAQSLQAFNDAVHYVEAFKLADMRMNLAVQRKLTEGIRAVFNQNSPPEECSQPQVAEVFSRGQLNDDEREWAHALASRWLTVHTQYIATIAKPALHRHVFELRAEFDRLYGLH